MPVTDERDPGGSVIDRLEHSSTPKRQRPRDRLEADPVRRLIVSDLKGEVHAAADEPIVLLEGRTDAKRALRRAAHHRPWRPLGVVLQIAYERKHLLQRPVNHHALLKPGHLHGSPCIGLTSSTAS